MIDFIDCVCFSGDNKVQMTFQMEAAKSYAAEKLANRKRILISVKSIKNIRVELEQYSALMDVDKSPSLCETIMYPAAYRFPFMDQVFPGEEVWSDALISNFHFQLKFSNSLSVDAK